MIALCGGIASGKSALGDRLVANGLPLFDADIASREAVEPGQPALALIAERFGDGMLQADGSLNRRALRQRVFAIGANPADRHDLESIVHPEVRRRLTQQLVDCREPVAVLAIPLLVEAWNDYAWVNRVLMVDVPEAVQIGRLTRRDGIDEPAARRMLEAQSTRQQRLALADDVVVNDGPISALDSAARRLAAHYRGLAPVTA
ncbi:MAG: dephospho-CoA kinase [Lysobacteraceae bacterium]